MSEFDEAFVRQSREYLTGDYLPKIAAAIGRMEEADIWWRPNGASNSIGHLLLHLSGNLRQWVVSGIGGERDRRQRHLEFDPADEPSLELLMKTLRKAVADADRTLAEMPLERLRETRKFQGRETTCFHALYHAIEHFSMHTGQILYIAKLRLGEDLRFYDVKDGIATARWPRPEE